MASQDALSLKFALEGPWHKEYGTFLMVPAFATLACCFIPIFHCEQGLSYMAIVPLTGAFSYGHTLSPRKPSYERRQTFMDYPAFVLASAKKTLSFAIPTGLAGWITSLFLNGYPKELAIFFETAVWGLASGICLCALMIYAEETFKLRKTDEAGYRIRLTNFWKWIVPPAIAFSLLVVAKSYFLLEIVKGRP
jgi:hypothetical protein